MGMYLPMSLTLVIPIGALLGRAYDRWAERRGGDVELKKRLGVLMATGLIVGESLFGVVFAGIVAASGSDAPLAVVGEGFENWAVAPRHRAVRGHRCWRLYRTTRRSADDRADGRDRSLRALRVPDHHVVAPVDRHQVTTVGAVHRRRRLLGGGADRLQLGEELLDPALQLVDELLQLDDPLDAGEVHALLLRQPLHLAEQRDVAGASSAGRRRPTGRG